MARTTNEIFEAILIEKANEPVLSEINNSSQTSRWRLFAYIVAKFHNLIELLLDKHITTVNNIVDNERYGELNWYKKKALLYQHGRQLIPESDQYNNSDLTEAEIETERVVKFANATEDSEGRVVVKVAKGVSGELEPLSTSELNGLKGYFKIRPAGVHMKFITDVADLLKSVINIQYDPLILDSTGKRLDGTADTPVLDAINNYLSSNIEFAGEFSNMKYQDAIQSVEGVVIVDVIATFSKYSDFDYEVINSRYRPYSGYMQFSTNDSIINYQPYD